MRRLYQYWLSPFSRKVRIALNEKGLDYEMEVERFWERRDEFLALNPAGMVPVLIEDEGPTLADSQAICEYLEEAYPDRPLLGASPAGRAETRRLVAWFDQKFHREVTELLLREKLMKRFMALGQPDSEAIRAAAQNITYHLRYIGWLVERRNWLAGPDFGLADIAAAAQLSCLDYLDNVPWTADEGARTWYARVKSRPAMRAILADHIPGMPPPRHYADLDF